MKWNRWLSVIVALVALAAVGLAVIKGPVIIRPPDMLEPPIPIPTDCNQLDNSTTRRVPAEGVGSIINADRARARDEALQDAFRRAVEQAVETFVESETYMENLKVIRDKIYSKAEGYVVCHNVLKESVEQDLYHVTIEALVLPDTLKVDLVNLQVMIKEVIGNPRVMVIIDERNLGEKQHFSIVESKLRTLFSEKGFYLVDQEQIDKIRESERAKNALTGDKNAALALASDLNSDIIVLGRASTTLLGSDIRGSFMDSAMARADIRVVITQTAQNVGNFSKEAKGLSTTEKEAGNEALASLTAELGDELIHKVIDAFNIAVANGVRSVQVVVRGISDFPESVRLAQEIGNLRGVVHVNPRSFEGKIAKLDVELRVATRDFAIRLQHMLGLKVTAYTTNKIEAEVVR